MNGPSSKTHGIDETGQTTRGAAPVAAVPVLHDMVYGGRLVQALDYPVLLHLLFNTAAGRSVTVLELWEELKTAGIRSAKNLNELVGKNAVYDAFARLITAGFVRRVEVPNERPGRRPRIAYEVFDNPAWNPDWQVQQVARDPLQPVADGTHSEIKAQVGPLPGTPEVVPGEVGISTGQPTSRNTGSGIRGTGVPGSGKRSVPAGQPTSGVPGRGSGFPPHPPEEVGTTSPYPHKQPTASAEQQQPTADIPQAELDEARDFLKRLPGKWSLGTLKAKNLAPLLVEQAKATGWPIDIALRIWLTRLDEGKGAIRNNDATLKYRIENLQLHDAVMAAANEPSKSASSGLPDWCGRCNGGTYPLAASMRTVVSVDPEDDTVARCTDCHPAMVRRSRS